MRPDREIMSRAYRAGPRREDADKFTGPLITLPPRPSAATLMRLSKGSKIEVPWNRRFLVSRESRLFRSRIRHGAFDDCLPDDRCSSRWNDASHYRQVPPSRNAL
jgi:hypothetical protein